MSCDRFEKELENRGGLKALQTDAAFARHRQECPVCEKKLAEHAKLFELLQADAPPMPDESYWAAFPVLVRERIESRKARLAWKPVLAWGSGLTALLLVAGIFFFRPGQNPDLSNLTAGEAFDYLSFSNGANGISLSEAALTTYTAQAEDELVGKNEVDELVYTLNDEELKKLEEKLNNFKL